MAVHRKLHDMQLNQCEKFRTCSQQIGTSIVLRLKRTFLTQSCINFAMWTQPRVGFVTCHYPSAIASAIL